MSEWRQALELWNEAAQECKWPLVRRLTADRERKLRALVADGLDDWKEALAKAKASDFLRGRTARGEKHSGWRFTFDAMIRESFFVKILEGNYDNHEATGEKFVSPMTALWEARLKNYKPGALWLGVWGPPPGEPGCQAPASLVEQWQQKHTH